VVLLSAIWPICREMLVCGFVRIAGHQRSSLQFQKRHNKQEAVYNIRKLEVSQIVYHKCKLQEDCNMFMHVVKLWETKVW